MTGIKLKAFVGVTDYDWFRFLSSIDGIEKSTSGSQVDIKVFLLLS